MGGPSQPIGGESNSACLLSNTFCSRPSYFLFSTLHQAMLPWEEWPLSSLGCSVSAAITLFEALPWTFIFDPANSTDGFCGSAAPITSSQLATKSCMSSPSQGPGFLGQATKHTLQPQFLVLPQYTLISSHTICYSQDMLCMFLPLALCSRCSFCVD